MYKSSDGDQRSKSFGDPYNYQRGCGPNGAFDPDGSNPTDEFLEQEFAYGLRLWHIIFLAAAAVLSLVILLCCCFKFRIPRTKQEIEADYIRRKILRKFRNRLKAIQNQELDEMDLKRALDKIRAEFKSDTESLAQSEAGFSVGTISSAGLAGAGGHHGSTYRRASQIAIDISLDEFRAQSMGVTGRLAMAFSRFFGRSKVGQSTTGNTPRKTAETKEPEGAQAQKPTTAAKAVQKSSTKNAALEATTVDETRRSKPAPAKATKEKKTDEGTDKKKQPKEDRKKPPTEDKKKQPKEDKKKQPSEDQKKQQTEIAKDKSAPKKDKIKSETKSGKDTQPAAPKLAGKAAVADEQKAKETSEVKPEAGNSKKQLEKLEKERKKEMEKREKERREQEKAEKMRKEKEKAEQVKMEKERAKQEKQRKEREAKEKMENEKKEKKNKNVKNK